LPVYCFYHFEITVSKIITVTLRYMGSKLH
jgi:hypothetical protein